MKIRGPALGLVLEDHTYPGAGLEPGGGGRHVVEVEAADST